MATLDISIAANADDGYANPTTDIGAFYDTSDSIILGSDDPGGGARECAGWFRFSSVPILTYNTADITTAYMTNYRISCSGTVRLKIYAEDADNPAASSDQADLYGATLTTAAVDWDPSSSDTGAVFNGPEIKTIIQEIMGRAGWAAGNAIQLIVRDDGSLGDNKLVVASYENAGLQEPILHIEYVLGANVIVWESD